MSKIQEIRDKIQKLESKRVHIKVLTNSYYGFVNSSTSCSTVNTLYTLNKAYRRIKQEIYYLKKIEERTKKIIAIKRNITSLRTHSGTVFIR